MPSLDLFLHNRRVGTITPDRTDRGRVALEVDRGYEQEILLAEAFAARPSPSGWESDAKRKLRRRMAS